MCDNGCGGMLLPSEQQQDDEERSNLQRRIRLCVTAYNGHHEGLFKESLPEPEYRCTEGVSGRHTVYRNLTTRVGVRDKNVDAGAYILAGTLCAWIVVHQPDIDVPASDIYYVVEAAEDAYQFKRVKPVTLMSLSKNNDNVKRLKQNKTLCVSCYWK